MAEALDPEAAEPPDAMAGWASFVAQRLEFEAGAAVAADALYTTCLRWCAGHGAVALEEDAVVAWLEAQYGVTLRTGPLTADTMVVGVRVVL